tara:strand:+ start:226 stop:567 length:342 start_codon:yes stop_codon:yes gene_type:complete
METDTVTATSVPFALATTGADVGAVDGAVVGMDVTKKHVGTALSFRYPVGHPVLGTQSLFVTSHHVDASQSAAEVAHTVAAVSLVSRQQQRRSEFHCVSSQVESVEEKLPLLA